MTACSSQASDFRSFHTAKRECVVRSQPRTYATISTKPCAPSNASALSSASYADQQTLIARHVVTTDMCNDGAAPSAVEHIGNEPLADIGRQMSDDVATGRVNPNTRVIGPRRIRDQDQLVARTQPT